MNRIPRLLLVLVIGVFGLVSCGSDEQGEGSFGANGMPGWMGQAGEQQVEAVSVKAYQATRKPISTFILSNTSLESIRKVTVFARVNAIVEKLFVEEGSVVRNGQVLAKLDDREIRNEFLQAQIALEQAQFAVKQAEVKARLSEANYARSKSLLDQKLISEQEYDQVALTNRTDALALDVAAQQLEAAEARLEAAQIQLDYTEIRSSINGVVTQRLIEVGTRVNANQEVFTVEEYPPLWARIYVPEKDLPQLRLGQRARLKVQALPQEEFEAAVHMISPTIDPQSGTVKVTLEVNRPRQLLRPGMFGTVYIATETHPDAIVIPKKSILRERDDNRVFVIKPDNTVEKRVVELGFSQDEEVEVLRGVAENEVVVTVGQEGLNDSYPVTILAWEGPEGSLPASSPPSERADIQTPDQSTATSPAPAGQMAANQAPPSGLQAGGQGRFGQGGPPDPERMKMFLDRMLQNPDIKSAYEEKQKEKPNFEQDPEELRRFLQEMRQKMGRGRQ